MVLVTYQSTRTRRSQFTSKGPMSGPGTMAACCQSSA
jgi:hypothetical protein